MSEYVPTTEQMLSAVARSYSHEQAVAWLAAHDAEVAAKALESVADELAQPRKLWHGDGGVTVLVDEKKLEHQKLGAWLRARAAEYRKAVQS